MPPFTSTFDSYTVLPVDINLEKDYDFDLKFFFYQSGTSFYPLTGFKLQVGCGIT